MHAQSIRANTHENGQKNDIHKKSCNYSDEVCNRNQWKWTNRVQFTQLITHHPLLLLDGISYACLVCSRIKNALECEVKFYRLSMKLFAQLIYRLTNIMFQQAYDLISMKGRKQKFLFWKSGSSRDGKYFVPEELGKRICEFSYMWDLEFCERTSFVCVHPSFFHLVKLFAPSPFLK